MEYKILIKLMVPEIEKSYELYVPVNKTIGEICILINKLINEDTAGIYPLQDKIALCNRFTSETYRMNVYLRDTNIRNGAQLILY